MKKLNYIFLLFLTILFVCCSVEKKNDLTENVVTDSSLIADIEKFNAQILVDAPITRAWSWDLLYHDFRCARSGARLGGHIGKYFGPKGAVIGFVAGGLIVGAAGSYIASNSCSGRTISYNGLVSFDRIIDDQILLLEKAVNISDEKFEAIKNEAKVDLQLPKKYCYLEEVGVLHNGLLENLEIESALVKKDSLSLVKSEITDPTALGIVKSEEFKKGYQTILNEILENEAESNETNHEMYLYIQNEDPLVVKILELFEEVYTQYPEKMEDYDFLINRYIEMIETSDEIAEEEKIAIYTGFAVAAYTPRFWNTYALAEK